MTYIRPTRRGAAVAAVAALMVTGLAACGSDDNSDGANATSGDSGEVTMWSRAPLERQATNAVDAYNANHDTQIKLEILPNDDVEGKVGAAVQTDTLPCLLAGDVVRVPYWTQQGVFADITDKIDSLENLDDLAVGHIEAGTYEGSKYTLPFVQDISVLVWNKDLYQEAGLDPEKGPTNLDEFVDQAEAVAALNKDGVSGSYLSGQSGGALVFTLFPSVWADGEEVMNADGTEALLDSDSAAAVFDAYRELAETTNGLGAGSQEETGATWTAPFAEGNVGVMPYPFTSVSGLFDTADFEIGVSGIPGSTGGSSTFLGGDAIGISSSCQNVDGAWDFLSWLMTDDAQQEVFADNNDTAANLSVLKNGYADADPRTQIANAVIENGRTPASVNFNEAFNAAGSPWQLLIQNAVWGDDDSLTDDNAAITAILGQ
ncbi:ABC transporter substrate-binding protein [Changpingibacter yushuensis]|uniref:ABC transporter substrate-binding protein n=1 Tax=Changpingibacter yushuensis TaxID=2758440 RepID=UPI0015F49435|nr:extracellular solute-binding protein [Changpingibacter yushuensis]